MNTFEEIVAKYRNIKCNKVFKKSEKLFFVIVLFVTIFRILINFKIIYSINPAYVEDDGLLYMFADRIKENKYLGDYNSRTLVKGISYSLLLAFNSISGLSYSMVLSILDVLSAYVFVKAFEKKIPNKFVLAVMYILILFNPVNLDNSVRQRMYRNALVPDMVVLTFSLLIGLFFRRNDRLKIQLKWAVSAGIALSFFYHLREDSFWIMPFVIVVTLLQIINLFFFNNKKNNVDKSFKSLCKRILVYVVPICILTGYTLSIMVVNKKHYGIFVVNDRSQSYFADAMQDIYRIDAKNENDIIWVSQDAIRIALNNSKSLRKIEAPLKEIYGRWGNGEDISGDLFSWIFRSAAEEKNFYKDANTANKYWSNVHKELKQAEQSGKIKTKSGIYFTKQARCIEISQMPRFFKLTVKNLTKVGRYSFCHMDQRIESYGNQVDIRRYEAEYGVYANLSLNVGDPKVSYAENITKFSNDNIKKYQEYSKYINGISFLSYIVLTIITLYQLVKKKYCNFEIWLMITGIILSAFVLMFGVTFFTIWLAETTIVFYGAGAYSLIQLAKYLSIVCAVKALISLKISKKR
ncbi:hypothetical protein [Lachnobacterium bovis]|uniref:hypothetical protein n=1 Tax=Lachnobacterium bovis TaxID=140626 RepID=UPI0003B55AEB|nr:hypothetical protein [Lachnobacterium bovis]